MSQIVKIQINADISDVADITAGTMDQVMSNLEQLRKLVLQVKKTLSDTDILNESDRQQLKKSLPLLDDAKMLLNKIDLRLGDVASISSGLVSVFENTTQQQNSATKQEEENDNISAR